MQFSKRRQNNRRKEERLDSKVMMSRSTKRPASIRKKRPSGMIKILRKKRPKKKRGGQRHLKRAIPNLIKSLFIVSLLLITLFIAYRGIDWVIGIRASKTETDLQLESVVGFETVPIFPGSEYVFQHSADDPIVENFISSGRSIYRIPLHTEIQDVFDYYQEELPDRGWAHLKFVPRTEKEQLYGDYWENGDRGIGLRIYDRVNDIWFERLSITDAREGLSRLAKQEIERELVLSSTEGTDFLPDFPWTIKVPSEYINSYYATDEGELQGVTISSITDGREFTLEPIVGIDERYPDQALEKFVEILNSREDDKSKKYEILNSTYNEQGLLEAILVRSGKRSTAVILINERTNYYYGLFFEGENDPFLNFLINNLRQKSETVELKIPEEE